MDITEVEFGSQVLGETRKKLVTVTNNGALGTNFDFRKITGECVKSNRLYEKIKSPLEMPTNNMPWLGFLLNQLSY